jgi:ankyrin repeat protein
VFAFETCGGSVKGCGSHSSFETTLGTQMNPLHCCALFNAPSQIPRLLMKNPLGARAAIMKNEFGATPLHVACAQPAVADSVTQVASLGTATSAAALDRHRRTPLHVAAQNSHATGDLIRVLSNLFPEALREQTQRGHLPLHLAAQSQVKESVIEALIAAYPEAATVKNKSLNTPLHDASKYRASPGVVNLLLDAYPDAVYLQNQYGNLPLHCATAYQAPPEVVKILLQAWPDGASMQNRNKVSARLSVPTCRAEVARRGCSRHYFLPCLLVVGCATALRSSIHNVTECASTLD